MARTGRFGRMPRQAPDLTNTIVSLLREYNAQVDSNYVDAWKNGGKVDGKPVTDGRLLAHMKSRRDGLDKDDPMRDEWNNRVTQYTFSIDDSKMQVKYDNGKASDADMARFYQHWADKTPNNTEFDRTLLSAVGKFRAAAAAKGRASAAAAGVAKFEHDIKRIEKNGPEQAQKANDALVAFARDTGIMPSDSKTLADLDVSSGRSAELLDVLKDGIDNGNPAVKTQIDVLEKKLVAIDPNFKWANAQDWFAQTFEAGAKGNQKGLNYLKGSKYSTDAWVAHFTNNKAAIQFANTKTAGLGIQNDVKANSDKLNDDIEAAHGDPFKEAQAFAAYNDAQTKVMGQLQKAQVGDYQDPLMIGLLNEQRNFQAAMGDGTDKPQSTWQDSVAGSTSQSGAQGGTGAGRYELAKSSKDAIELLGQGGWMQVSPDPNDPTGTKSVYQVQSGMQKAGAGAVLMPGAGIRDPITGAVIPVYGVPEPVQAMTVDPGGSQLGIPSLKTDDKGQPIPVLNTDGTQAKNSDGSAKWETLGENTGIEAIKSIDSSGNSYFIYRTRNQDGSWILSEEPPLVPGANAQVRDVGGKPVIQVTVDPNMIDPATGKAAGPTSVGGAAQPAYAGSKFDISKLDRTDQLSYFKVKDDLTTEYLTKNKLWTPSAVGQAPKPDLPADVKDKIEADAVSKFNGIQQSAPNPAVHQNIITPVAPAELAKRQAAATAAKPTTTPTGPTTAGLAGQVAQTPPGYDVTKYIDTTATNVDPNTGELHAGYYRSTLGLSLSHELNVLKPTDPDYAKKVTALSASIQGGQTQLAGMLQAAQARGDNDEAAKVVGELNLWQHDQPNLNSELTRVQNRTPDPAAQLTNPANPINQYFGMTPQGVVANKGPNGGETRLGSPEAVSKYTLNATTDRFDAFGPFGGSAATQAGAPGRPGMAAGDPRELKLPGLGNVPFLKPLLDFAKGAGVPQLTPGATQPLTPGGPAASAVPGAPVVTPAAPTGPLATPAAPKPPKPKPDKGPKPPAGPSAPPPGSPIVNAQTGFTTGTAPGGERDSYRPYIR